ncbi:MAG: hypothetical protein ACTS9Y_07710 [Methylophilus sp.]|uniref:hypothetical protein n=1 Tax=Methylophilus sp. TaxID=29541 RepID=UPI003FA0E693
MATDPKSVIEGAGKNPANDHDLNLNRSNDGNTGSPPTTPEIEPGKIPGVDPEKDPAIEPEIEPGKILDDSLIPHKSV